MQTTTYLIAPQGTVVLNGEANGYRWLTEEGENTETSATTRNGAITAGLAAWPGGVVVIIRDDHPMRIDMLDAIAGVVELPGDGH